MGRGGVKSVGPLYEASFASQQGRGGCFGVGRLITEAARNVATRGAHAIGEEAARATFGLIQDVRQNPSFAGARSAVIERASQAGRNLKRRARNILTGRGEAKKPKKSPPKKKKAGSQKRRPASSPRNQINSKSHRKRSHISSKPRRAQKSRKKTATSFPDIFS